MFFMLMVMLVLIDLMFGQMLIIKGLSMFTISKINLTKRMDQFLVQEELIQNKVLKLLLEGIKP